jgi:hypothetical protein
MAGNPKNEIVVISDSDSESEYGEEQQEEDQQDDEEQQEKERLAAERRKIFYSLQARFRKLSEEEQEEAKLTKLPKTPKKTNAGPSVPPTPPDSTQKLNDSLIEDDDSLPEEAEGVQNEATPPPRLGNFRISRLIRNADKSGQERRSEIVLDDPNFTVGYGDYLLRLDDDALALQGLFRNMASQDGTVPIRMTQRVFRPWGLPSRIPLDRNGAGLPIAFSTRAARNAAEGWGIVRNEALFVGDPDTEEDVKVDILDVDRRLMSLPRRSLEKRYQYPWNLRIDEDALDLAAGKTRPEDLEDEVSGEEDDTYNAAFGFNNPRKRKATSHANSGSPTPSKKKSSIKFAPQVAVTPAESLEDDIFDFDSDDSNEIKDDGGDIW